MKQIKMSFSFFFFFFSFKIVIYSKKNFFYLNNNYLIVRIKFALIVIVGNFAQ